MTRGEFRVDMNPGTPRLYQLIMEAGHWTRLPWQRCAELPGNTANAPRFVRSTHPKQKRARSRPSSEAVDYRVFPVRPSHPSSRWHFLLLMIASLVTSRAGRRRRRTTSPSLRRDVPPAISDPFDEQAANTWWPLLLDKHSRKWTKDGSRPRCSSRATFSLLVLATQGERRRSAAAGDVSLCPNSDPAHGVAVYQERLREYLKIKPRGADAAAPPEAGSHAVLRGCESQDPSSFPAANPSGTIKSRQTVMRVIGSGGVTASSAWTRKSLPDYFAADGRERLRRTGTRRCAYRARAQPGLSSGNLWRSASTRASLGPPRSSRRHIGLRQLIRSCRWRRRLGRAPCKSAAGNRLGPLDAVLSADILAGIPNNLRAMGMQRERFKRSLGDVLDALTAAVALPGR